MVADGIFKVIDALKLLGVETVLTGIRPEVAQTTVSIAIDFNNLTIKSSLQKATEISLFVFKTINRKARNKTTA
ncbi:modulator protein RsbR, partial [Priestia megaterium]|uniref:Modulator protein RsbR n=1 Tax=Priestia megaterium (strain DSM 319 / IMG 1521) TaxID=592022 RepID=D5DK79_PRIM3